MDRAYTSSELITDGIIHVVGVSAGLIAVTTMLVIAIHSLPALSIVCLFIYGVGMLAMFSFSAAYHLVRAPRWKGTLRRLDQAAIFLKIAGTYTPFALIKLGGVSGYALLSSVWIIALLGAAAKLMLSARWDQLAVVLYLALGWAIRVAILGRFYFFDDTSSARYRRHSLHHRCGFSSLVEFATSECDLAFVRASRNWMSFRRRRSRTFF